MPSASPLSVAFIERHPSAAARILENLAIDDAAALISVLPGYASASALGRMTPFAAAQCMAQLDTDQVTHLLRTMMFLDAASILRVMSVENRDAVMEALVSVSITGPRTNPGLITANSGFWLSGNELM